MYVLQGSANRQGNVALVFSDSAKTQHELQNVCHVSPTFLSCKGLEELI